MAIVGVEMYREPAPVDPPMKGIDEFRWWDDTIWIQIQCMYAGDTANLTCDASWEHRWGPAWL